ncbi:universal stress protein [Psychromarinibacter sp. C21-152]|uniref:Universal stress protein n=1 Tax=Psychromarinibacter sediminicola TaxID=3033385 RepID=A0AAE3NWQ9_9RHOB|nr:universal stress protein [Psychromarinibacter sediminicola]MDF0602027.1 universal stress protein [Psychromarinibacter sediminicola]
MYRKIMAPVDLAHLETLGKALDTAADIAKHYGAELCYVGVTAETPGAMGHNPKEYDEKLKAFAEEQAAGRGINATYHTSIAHDPTTDLDDVLLDTVKEIGADLVVMGTHKPGLADYIWPSNGGKIAAHTPASVFLVRDS